MAPTAHVGMIVTARTPQRLRLGQVTIIKNARTVIGRGRADCFVDDPAVAEFHAVIVYQRVGNAFGFCLHTDVSATTSLNRRTSESVERLQSGDHIALGDTDLVFFEVTLDRGSDV
jgi:predicted component of type VI protein secretion system